MSETIPVEVTIQVGESKVRYETSVVLDEGREERDHVARVISAAVEMGFALLDCGASRIEG